MSVYRQQGNDDPHARHGNENGEKQSAEYFLVYAVHANDRLPQVQPSLSLRRKWALKLRSTAGPFMQHRC
jgi:hypothetical protein